MKLTSSLLALLALAAGLVITGCGDNDETSTTETTGATGAGGATGFKAEFITAADKICKDAEAALADEALAQYPEGPPIADDASKFAEEVVIPNLEGQYEAIATLVRPEGEEDAVADFLEKLQAGIDEFKENPEDFVESPALEDASAAAKELGLKECGA